MLQEELAKYKQQAEKSRAQRVQQVLPCAARVWRLGASTHREGSNLFTVDAVAASLGSRRQLTLRYRGGGGGGGSSSSSGSSAAQSAK